jgi:hypothetical protein
MDLIACALETAVPDMAAYIARSIGAYASGYLSKEHRDERSGGCAYATLDSLKADCVKTVPQAEERIASLRSQ